MMRYVPARALPAIAYLPGAGEPPRLAPDDDPYRWGLDLFNHGFPWEAHEAWEGAWAKCPKGSVERARLAGLIQLAAAVVQARLGRARGVALLAARAAQNLIAAGDPSLAAQVTAWATDGAPIPVLAPEDA